MLNRGARRMVVLVLVLLSLSAGPARITLVVCSPGSPGDTAQAQPTMDQFAGALAQAAGWPADSLAAVYFETSAGGGQRLEQGDAPAALVSLPFYYEYARALSLVPALEAVPESGAGAVYRLVARSGALKSPATLADWEIVGGIGFSPDFVRREVLAGWGPIPDSARISFSARPLSALRRAASGEKIAVLLDPEQSAALPSLPFSSDLETVATSREFPGGIFCLVKGRLPEARAASLVDALRKLGSSETGKAALQAIRIREFRAIDLKRIPAAVSGTNSSHP